MIPNTKDSNCIVDSNYQKNQSTSMGICKSSTNKEKKSIMLPQQQRKSIEKPSNSIRQQLQETSIQFTQKKDFLKLKSARSGSLKRPDPSPVKSLKKVIEVSLIPLGQKYSVTKSPNGSKDNIPQTLVQHNNGGQIRRLQKFKGTDKNKSYIRWLIDTELSNPHICQVVEIFKEKSSILLIEEYCSDGELTQMIQKGPIRENVCAIIVEQILEIVQYLHGKGLVHGNLQLSSFGLQNTSIDFFVKLIENRNIFEKQKITVQDMPYLAPEMLAEKTSPYLTSGDMWSIGIITYQLLFGKCLYENLNVENPRKNIITMHEQLILWSETQLSKDCQDFLESILKIDPNQRATADIALQCKWIESGRQIDNKFLKPLYNLSQAKPALKVIRSDKLTQNGLLDKTDINNLFQKVYNNKSMAKDVNQVFANLDTDGNNGINFQEFLIGTIDKASLLQDEHLEDTYKLLGNSQGFITAKSLLRLITCDEQFLKQEFRSLYSDKLNKKQYLEIFQDLIK